MSKNNHFNRVSTNVDLDLLKLNSAQEQLRKIKRNESKLVELLDEAVRYKTIKVSHALKILNQQWVINGIRPKTVHSYNYTFEKFIEFRDVEYLHEIRFRDDLCLFRKF